MKTFGDMFGGLADWLDLKVHRVWQTLVYGLIPFGAFVLMRGLARSLKG